MSKQLCGIMTYPYEAQRKGVRCIWASATAEQLACIAFASVSGKVKTTSDDEKRTNEKVKRCGPVSAQCAVHP
jgi:hypothetical protein